MPPTGKLDDREIGVLTHWVELGARGRSRPSSPRRPPSSGSPTNSGASGRSSRSRRRNRPPSRTPPGTARPSTASSRPSARRWDLTPVALADKRTLIRRATFDLTGLPPTPEEVDAFLADDSPRRVRQGGRPAAGVAGLRRALGPPLARRRPLRRHRRRDRRLPVPQAYRYRNYVIDAFNDDKPYDQFVREQIAGDLLPGATLRPPGRAADRHRLPRRRPPLRLRPAELPPPHHPGHHRHARQGRPRPDRRLRPLPRPQVRPDLAAGLLRALRHLRQHQVPVPRLRGTQGGRATSRSCGPANPSTPSPRGRRTTLRIQKRGDPKNPGPEAPRRFLQILGGQPLPADCKGSGRLQLAEWLTDPNNPLTARVMVNRIWQHHFGEGLVRTPNDFGKQGQPPTHPELLDYLADRFVRSGWSVKAMHRLILLSRTYQMASTDDEADRAIDPNNEGLWRYDRRRLDAEAIRDSLLAVSGALDRSHGGTAPVPAGEHLEFHAAQPVLGRLRDEPPQRLPDDAADAAAPVPGPVRRRRPQRQHRPALDDDGADAGAVLPERPVRPRAGGSGSPPGCCKARPTTRAASTWPTASPTAGRRRRTRRAPARVPAEVRPGVEGRRACRRRSRPRRRGRATPACCSRQRVHLRRLIFSHGDHREHSGKKARSVRRFLWIFSAFSVTSVAKIGGVMNDPRCCCTRRDALRFAFGGAGSLLAAGLLHELCAADETARRLGRPARPEGAALPGAGPSASSSCS